jgi:NADH:ubiquinone oxidoreductase subunit 6 (subunit J)
MIAALAFYLFAAILIACAVMVVTSRNPVQGVLFLILGFFNAAALFLLAGAEFLAMILVIVYVGAVAVLFLFVVMMLDIDFARLREGFRRNAPLGLVIGGILLIELLMVFAAWRFAPEAAAPQVVKAEEPAACPRCNKLFGTKASIARVKTKLSAHWMFADPARQALLELCEDCRVLEATNGGIDPYAGAPRPVTKTTEDYLREAERAKRGES